MSLKDKFIINKNIKDLKQAQPENQLDNELLEWVFDNFEAGSKILQIGNLKSSTKLIEKYNFTGLVSGKRFIKVLNCNYINCPIVNYEVFLPGRSSSQNSENSIFNLDHMQYSWFDINVLGGRLDEKYDLILVDGPNFKIGRMGFAFNLNLFNSDASFLIHRTHTFSALSVMKAVSKSLNRQFETFECSSGKRFSVIK